MPLFNSKGQILAGVAGTQSTVDGVPMPVFGNAAWLDDDHVIGQSLDATKVISVPVVTPDIETELVSHGANLVVAGNGKWASFYQPANAPSEVDGSLGVLPGAYVYAAGDDGTIAWKRVYQSGAGLTLTAPDGSVIDVPTANPIDVQVLGPGQAIWLQSGGGIQSVGITLPVTALEPWQTRIVTLGTDRWVVYGTHQGGLIAQKDGATDGYVLVPVGSNAFNIDAKVINGAIHIAWSLTRGEPWNDVRQLTLDITQPTTQLTAPHVSPPAALQAHPRKLWLAPYYSFSVRYGDAPIEDWHTYANAAVIEGDDASNIPADLQRVFGYGVPMIVGQEYGAQTNAYLGNIVAWLASGADYASLQTAIQSALTLPEKPVIAYLDAPEQWPTAKPTWMVDRVWPAVQAYRKVGESVTDFQARLQSLLTQIASYGSYIILTARWDDVNGSQPVNFTTDCMPAYASFIQNFPICGIMPFSDKRGHGISEDAILKQWAQLFSLANVTRPNRFDYWTSQQAGLPATLKNKLGQSTDLMTLTATEKTYLISKL